MSVSVKRVYEKPARSDGARVLVDRLWPRGLSKQTASLDVWLKNLSPSDGLRRWFHAHPDQWLDFRKRYLKELSGPDAHAALEELYVMAGKRKHVTLLFASKNEEHNNATVLRDMLEGMRKPPTGAGPGRAASMSRRSRLRP